MVQLTSSCNQPNYFNQANVSKMTIILDMSKFMKRTSSLTCRKMAILIIIFNLLKVSKITILRISISSYGGAANIKFEKHVHLPMFSGNGVHTHVQGHLILAASV